MQFGFKDYGAHGAYAVLDFMQFGFKDYVAHAAYAVLDFMQPMQCTFGPKTTLNRIAVLSSPCGFIEKTAVKF